MPVKIVTDQPQAKRKTLQALMTDSYATVAEAPYFSIPLADEDTAILDPDDFSRELRAGELFFATGIQIANDTETVHTVDVQIVSEGGVATSLSPGLLVPAHDVLILSPGLSLFKRDLADPTDPAMLLQVRASANSALTLTASVVEREAIDHAPDTEGV
jgi:hypothetical protein